MKITTTTITKYELTELSDYRLDPVTFVLEDLGPRQGKLTVSCYGEAWSAFWGGMGERPLIDFLLISSADYIANKLFHGDRYEPDFSGFFTKEKKSLLELRRSGEFGKHDARRLWDDLMDQGEVGDYHGINHELATILVGDDWHCCIDSVPTHKYQYVTRIVTAMLDALKQIKEGSHGEAGQDSCAQL